MSQANQESPNVDKVIRVLMIEDDAELAEQYAGELVDHFEESDVLIKIAMEASFSSAMERIVSATFDLLILDLRDDGRSDINAGLSILNAVQGRIFVPIIFHTAHPEHVRSCQSPLVWIVSKVVSSSEPGLIDVVEEVLKERLPQMKRALREHVDGVLRTYMWGIVNSQKDKELIKDPPLLVHVLARQIVHSLDASMLPKLFDRMGVSDRVADGKIHPIQMYIYPPPYIFVRGAGDLVLLDGEEFVRFGVAGFWMVLSARCDLVHTGSQKRRVNYLVMAHILPALEHPKAKDSHGVVKPDFRQDPKQMIEGRDQYYFLPRISKLEPSFVDFGRIVSLPIEMFSDVRVFAILDDPFAAEMLLRHQRFFGRFGTVDLDRDAVRRGMDGAETP